MPTSLTWHDIALRLILDIVAAALIGINRDEYGRPAGLRTNLLVSLAACIAMIQTNLLINSTGKSSDSFVVMDIMRLPLGILSGIGFIGAGAIIKRADLVVGVTTAATLWFVTVMGLCFGGGQIYLGIAACVIGFVVLALVKRLEFIIPREHAGELTLTLPANGADEAEIAGLLKNSGFIVASHSIATSPQTGGPKTVAWYIRWKGKRNEMSPPPVLRELANRPGIERVELVVARD
ncbi:MAG TPA: MgtC/SapB family protein [Candidatus Acidoferrales bacterium]